VIVMITKLVEGEKDKADQYWPDTADPVFEVSGGVKVNHVSDATQDTYTLREFTIQLGEGSERRITQIQTEMWPDLSAPEEPMVLVDILLKAEALQGTLETPILVHCSAGVGRTGTFIALYKLWMDFQDKEKTSLAIMPTMHVMRQQRVFMVQRPVQYRYIAKCLSFLINSKEGEAHYVAQQLDKVDVEPKKEFVVMDETASPEKVEDKKDSDNLDKKKGPEAEAETKIEEKEPEVPDEKTEKEKAGEDKQPTTKDEEEAKPKLDEKVSGGKEDGKMDAEKIEDKEDEKKGVDDDGQKNVVDNASS